MRKILLNLGIEKKATTYIARHTFSMVLKRSGASTEFIQEALGHTDIKTAEHYLDSFDREMKKNYNYCRCQLFQKPMQALALNPCTAPFYAVNQSAQPLYQ